MNLSTILVVAMTFGVVIILAALPFVMVVWIIKAIKNTTRSPSDATSREEARMIQEIYKSLGGMEQRIDAVETILADHVDLRKENEPAKN